MTTLHRLQQYRREALNPRWVRPLTWRDTKRHHKSAWGAPRPNNVRTKDGAILSDSIGQYGRDLGTAHDLFPRAFENLGYYADNFQDETIIGHVCRMRCSKGTLYIPATMRTDSDGTIHYFGDVERVAKGADQEAHESAQREAARSADHYAEREAEEAREDNAKYMAEADIEAARAEIHGINKFVLALLGEIKAAGADFTPAICTALRAEVQQYLRDRAEQFKIIREREADYWTAAPGY